MAKPFIPDPPDAEYERALMNNRSYTTPMAPRRAAALRDQSASETLGEHLVASTDALLDEAPLGQLTTRRIAQRAGVSDGVLYNHFPDKSSLVLAALLRRYGRLVDRFERAAPSTGGDAVATNLQAFARALCDLEADAPLLERFWVEIHRDPFGIGRLRQPLLDYLAAEQESGGIGQAVDLDAVTTLVFGASAMAALTLRVNRHADRAAVKRHLDQAIATIVTGIAPGTAGD
jgi:AcrR family transcriptional regulator